MDLSVLSGRGLEPELGLRCADLSQGASVARGEEHRSPVVKESGRKAATGPAEVDSSRRVAADSIHAIAIPGGYTWLHVALWPVKFGLFVLMWLSLLTLVVYLLPELDHLDPGASPLLHDPITWLHHWEVVMRDQVGGVYAGIVGHPASADAAAVTAGVSFVGRQVASAFTPPPRRRVPVPAKAVAVAPVTRVPRTPSADDLVRARDKRVARVVGVQAALMQLDAEWLSYEMDLDAYYLTKPLLRDPEVAETAAYQAALYELRTLAESLGESCTAAQLDAAEQAADAALLAWGEANDHALAVGVSDRSPTERAALRRLHALTGQLADPSTPEPMCRSLIEAISREMAKLTTVPASWEHLSRVPALEHRNPAAIAAAGQK